MRKEHIWGEIMRKLILFIMGPQGSGKDTQAELLSKRFKIPTFSAGGLLREEIKNKSSLSDEINSYISKGFIVPTRIIYQLIMNKINQPECERGFILNGYPRNREQAEAIKGKIEPTFVILLDIPDKVAIERISHRMICPKCGRVYTVKDPSKQDYCEVCHAKLVRREDDREEVIKKRLELYHKETEPLKEIYKSKLLLIDGTNNVVEVFNDIKDKINNYLSQNLK